MIDPSKIEFAPWMEKTLKMLIEGKATRIAMVAIDDEGAYYTSLYKCRPVDLYGMSGVLQSEGTWQEIKVNAKYLREIIEGDVEEDENDA